MFQYFVKIIKERIRGFLCDDNFIAYKTTVICASSNVHDETWDDMPLGDSVLERCPGIYDRYSARTTKEPT